MTLNTKRKGVIIEISSYESNSGLKFYAVVKEKSGQKKILYKSEFSLLPDRERLEKQCRDWAITHGYQVDYTLNI